MESEKRKTIEEAIPEFIKACLKDATGLSDAYGMSRTEALLLMVLVELNKMHSHVDKMAEALQIIDKKDRKR